MKRFLKTFLTILVLLLVGSQGFADDCGKTLTGPFPAGQATKLCDAYSEGVLVLDNSTYLQATGNSGTVVPIIGAVGDDTLLRAEEEVAVYVGETTPTPVAYLNSSGLSFETAGQGVKLPKYVPTMAATPAAGTNDLKVGLNIVPTAAANTAALLKATPVVGDQYMIYNSGANAVRIKAGGAATINGASAGGYIGLAGKTAARCITTAADNHSCELLVNPTPAGP